VTKKDKQDLLKIGRLAEMTGVTPRTIRFYVQEGLLPEPHFTQKNMAYYSTDYVDKIRAIKTVQKEKFLPLVVIRRILEKNDFDYEALKSTPSAESGEKEDRGETLPVPSLSLLLEAVPQEVLDTMASREWGRHTIRETGKTDFEHDPVLLNLLATLNRSGVPWEEVMAALEDLQKIISKAVELEFRTMISILLKKPDENLSRFLPQQEHAIDRFIRAVRRKKLDQITRRYKQNMDNAYLASADEGFAVQPDEVLPELIRLERRLPADGLDIRILNDLSIGYSCAGNLEKAVQYLDRVREKVSENLETKVRWFWHKRFTVKSDKDSGRLKQQMTALVNAHPDFALARIFLAMWHFIETRAYDDHGTILSVMRLSIGELERAETCKTGDLHEWMVVRYFTGIILTAIHSPVEYTRRGIRAFESILDQKEALDRLYAGRMAFYSKWLWPNIYFFLGNAYLNSQRHDDAVNMLQKGLAFKMMPPYRERLNIALRSAETRRAQDYPGSHV